MDSQSAARRPTTFLEAVSAYPDSIEARERFEELALRIELHGGGEPLTLAEYLEAVATGERLAVHYRDRGRVHGALLAGATWAQIADATAATTEALARRDYREWAAGEHNTWVKSGHQSGLDEAEYAAAIARAEG